MLMSCQGVKDDIFMKKLKNATQKLETTFMVSQMYQQVCEIAE